MHKVHLLHAVRLYPKGVLFDEYTEITLNL